MCTAQMSLFKQSDVTSCHIEEPASEGATNVYDANIAADVTFMSH